MILKRKEIICQVPPNRSFIVRKPIIIQCSILKNSAEYRLLYKKAIELAGIVNPAAANATHETRGSSRLLLDAFGGVLAEAGWIQYINDEFGSIANSTSFESATDQIDIIFSNGELAEVRSSFPQNGVKFALCSNKYNFKNLGPYANRVKPGEIQKQLYLGVLFDTQKQDLLNDDTVVFSLVGGSTWSMMVDKGHNESLVPKDGFAQERSSYKVIEFKNALDASGMLEAIENLGYKRKKLR